jgi:hypothetical protein
MPKITCKCGANINMSAAPHPDLAFLFPDMQRELLTDSLSEAISQTSDAQQRTDSILLTIHEAFKKLPALYECRNCNRLIVFRTGSDAIPYVWLKPDDEASIQGFSVINIAD